MAKPESRLRDIILSSGLVPYLQAVQTAQIPDAWLAAGAIRNTVWKHMYKEGCRLPVKDLDVVYFSAALSQSDDDVFSSRLERILPTGKWECVNQAHVHLYQPRPRYWQPNAPYESVADSMRDWTFTANAIGVRLGKQGSLEILAPFGLDDLFDGIIRLTEAGKTDPRPYLKEYTGRVLGGCPKLRLIE